MKPLPSQIPDEDINFSRYTINSLIDHLTDYEAEQDRRLTELSNRIQTIANLQLEMKRGEKPAPCTFGTEGTPGIRDTAQKLDGFVLEAIKEQPKRWRATKYHLYWYVESNGEVSQDTENESPYDDYRYSVGNYYQTPEQAIAYKARLLELGQQL